MLKEEVERRLRRASEIALNRVDLPDREDALVAAWEPLHGLRSDDFPDELRPQFNYLLHEVALRRNQEMSSREIRFLLQKICELEQRWLETSETFREDRPQQP